MKIKKIIKMKFFEWRLKRAIKKANRMYHLTAAKFFVIMYNGKPIVKAKKSLKEMIHKKQLNCMIQDLEKIALYITP